MQFLDLSFWEEAMRGLFAAICQLVYPLIAWLYSLFINISNVNILSEDTVAPIYQRITLLLTIVMVFYVTFQFVKFVVQPDEITDKEKGTGKIIYKMIMVVVLIAFVPKLFEGAFWVQGKIMNNDLIGKIILGQATNGANGPDELGRVFSANIFSLFYKFEPDESKDIAEDAECGDIECKQVIALNLNFLKDKGDLTYLTLGLNESTEIQTPIKGETEDMALITFNYLMATAVGVFVAYMLVLYCIDAGARWAQLIFLQIVAPIPIIGYLAPKKDGIFQKWVKQCVTTYLDLFIRIGIIYFVMLICQILTNSLADGTLFAGLEGLTPWMRTFVYIGLILGLMMFAKKAPKMLEELFPKTGAASGNFGLKAGERIAPLAARGAGAALAAGLTGARKAIGAGVARFKRNRDNKADRQANKDNYKASKDAYKQARQRRKDIQNDSSMDKNQKEAELKKARQAEQDAKLNRQNAKAKHQNTKYRAAPLAALAGAATGTVQGAWHGAKAKELKEVGKQVKEGFKAADTSLNKTEKWYNSGGGSYVNRAVSSVESAFGIPTSAHQMENQIKRYDDKIKRNEALMNIEGDVKKKSDAVESRLTSKLDTDAKIKANKNTIDYLQEQFNSEFGPTADKVDIGRDEKLADVRKKYKSKSESASAKLDAAIKQYGANSKEAKDAETEKVKAQKQEEIIMKYTMRDAYTQMMTDPNVEGVDKVAVQNIDAMKASVTTAGRNIEIVEKYTESIRTDQEKIAKDPNLSNAEKTAKIEKLNKELDKFQNPEKIKTYDDIDDIITRLKTIEAKSALENDKDRESKRQLEAGYAYAAAKADNDSTGKK